jgi:PIN domain nuclease of toxin-antitoxin system
VRLLLDTHTFLWFVLGDSQLSATARTLIMDPAHDKLISPVCFWEVAIKVSVNKYRLSAPHEQFFANAIRATGCTILPIEPKHTAVLAALPFHHKDPFDRLLVAQALAEDISLVSGDAALDAYGVRRVW